MSKITLSVDHPTEVQVGDKLFALWEGDDGSLYIEAPGRRGLTVAVSDDDESQVSATGLWVNVDLLPEE